MKKLLLFAMTILLLSCHKEETDLQVLVSDFRLEQGKMTLTTTVTKGELPVTLLINVNESRTDILSETITLNTHEPKQLIFTKSGITPDCKVWIYWTNKYSTGIGGMKL